MSVQYSTAVANACLDAWETTIGTSAVVEVRTGAQPADCATADSGTLLVSFTLASDWAANAGSGSKTLNNLPVSANASATGTAAHYRIKSSGGTCHEQGSVTVTGGGGDMTVDNTSILSGQEVRITGYTKNTTGWL